MTEFHYVPTGTGVISGREVLRQTEDAINNALEDGGDTREIAERALANSETSLQQSGQAVETANSALTTSEQAKTSAASAVSTANQANATAASALSTAQQASTAAQNAATAAQAAQTAAEDAASDAADSEDIASQALTSAQSAQTAAEAAQTAAQTAQTNADQSATIATQAQQAAAQSAQEAQAAAAAVGASARQIGEIITSSLPLTTAGLHLLDGALIDGDGIYADFVTYIAGLNQSAAFFCTEAQWQASVTQYGVCGKFVYDSVANTVRLPKITGITEGTTDLTALGDLVEAGLPNITAFVKYLGTGSAGGDDVFSGALAQEGSVDDVGYGPSGIWSLAKNITFDASRSSPIYGNSTTVQPQTIKTLVYIVVATVTKTEIQVDIDNVVTELNRLDSVVTHVAPVGSYIYYAGGSVPDHYLLCNGAAVSRSEYVDLFNIIGTTYGSGDGSTTFNLPNLIDKFIEGSGTSGTVKNAGLPNHNHGINEQFLRNSSGWDFVNYAINGTLGGWDIDYTVPNQGAHRLAIAAHDTNNVANSSIYGNSTTVQPPALTALPCIRYE